jgi:short-subunit dehydrogenase
MEKVIAVFGAGPGLGASVARRFGREGYRVALIARRQEPLAALAAELSSEGIRATVFTADLTRSGDIPALVETIRSKLGRIDIVEYAPIATAPAIPAKDLTQKALEGFISLYLYTPIALVNAVLPAMIERGDGAILIGQGGSAAHGVPFASGVGPPMAAARNYVHSLHGEVADKGVYVGTLTVGAIILNSAGHKAFTSGELTLPPGMEIPTVDPDDLADLYWDLVVKHDRIEVTYPSQP